jgi:hypothetical protein
VLEADYYPKRVNRAPWMSKAALPLSVHCGDRERLGTLTVVVVVHHSAGLNCDTTTFHDTIFRLDASILANAAAPRSTPHRSGKPHQVPVRPATALNVHATLTELLGDEPATAALLGEAVALSL